MTHRIALIAVLLVTAISFPASAGDRSWTGFRGTGDSVAHEADLPLSWSDEANLGWKCDLPGYGQSSPVVWGDRAFVTSVVGENKEKVVVSAVAIDGGTILWSKEFPATKTVKATDYVSRAAPTPVVDDKNVYAFFESGDLIALTHAGESAWNRSLTSEFGDIKGNHGLGSSPAQTETSIVVLVDHDGPSYLISVEKETGKTLWKKDRPKRVSWSSPLVCAGPQGPEVLVSSNGVVQAFRGADGELLWEVAGLKGNTIASPSVTGETVLIGSGQVGDNLLIRRGGSGDVTSTHVTWRAPGVSTSFGSPLVHRDTAYFVNKAGAAFAVNLADGKTLWTQRLPDSTWASPVAAGDRIYFFCKNGTTIVSRPGNEFEKLAENQLTIEGRLYGVAAIPGAFLLRTGSRLLCVRDAK